jgi:hypothetical protein
VDTAGFAITIATRLGWDFADNVRIFQAHWFFPLLCNFL